MIEQSDTILIYQDSEGRPALEVKLDQETVWLTQEQMSLLFGRERSVITKHIGNIFREGELAKESNVQNMHIAHSDKPVVFYNLDVIISVGYVSRIDSKIILIDGTLLPNLMFDHGVGVTKLTTYELKRIDSNYFVEE